MSKIAFVLLLVSTVALANDQTAVPPDFTGQWQFKKDQSDTGGFRTPESLRRTVTFRDALLQVHTIQTDAGKPNAQDMKYFTNGFETKNSINGLNAFSTAHWQDTTLLIHTNLQDAQGDAVVIEEQWSLATDKRTLTTTTKIITTRGATTSKLVWQKGE